MMNDNRVRDERLGGFWTEKAVVKEELMLKHQTIPSYCIFQQTD